MKSRLWERWAAILLCVCLGGLLAYGAARLLLPVLIPFLLAWLLSRGIRPLAKGLARRTRLPQKLWAGVLTLLFFGGIAAGAVYFVRRGFSELGRLLDTLMEDGGLPEAAEQALARLDAWIWSVLPGNGAGKAELRQQINDLLRQMLGGLLSSISAALPVLAARLLEALPSAVLVSMITVIAAFYFCMDDGTVVGGLVQCLPAAVQSRLPGWRQRMRQISLRNLRAYLLLWLITFSGLFLGFCLLGVEYALLLAAVTAVVDLLPVLGVGTVLVPWAILALAQRNFFLWGGLLILYGVLLVLRQMIEPRLVGKSLGLHPLLTLFASYAGWRLLGFLGMLLGPALALLLRSVAMAWRKREGEGT